MKQLVKSLVKKVLMFTATIIASDTMPTVQLIVADVFSGRIQTDDYHMEFIFVLFSINVFAVLRNCFQSNGNNSNRMLFKSMSD